MVFSSVLFSELFKIFHKFRNLHAEMYTLDPIHAFVGIFLVKMCFQLGPAFFEVDYISVLFSAEIKAYGYSGYISTILSFNATCV